MFAEPGGVAGDLGSGGGVPGLPLALVTPGWTWLLIEAMSRRADFLRRAVSRLSISARVHVLDRPAEEVGRGRWAGRTRCDRGTIVRPARSRGRVRCAPSPCRRRSGRERATRPTAGALARRGTCSTGSAPSHGCPGRGGRVRRQRPANGLS